ncbi:hypothetical protein ACVR05_02115 [Streptococcus caprae]|uniref:Lipoprotein n=1 Tax=Streptococcus caprae TaxID=1640501 RepID=A0ABV8CWM5_9STRE
MTGMLIGCHHSKSVEEELQPMFEILDKQEIELNNVSLIKDSFHVYNVNQSISFLQFNLEDNLDNSLSGTFFKENSEERVEDKVLYTNNELHFESLDNRSEKLFFQEFHFSKEYFKSLQNEGESDSVERYEKIIKYREKIHSTYSKKLIKEYSLSKDSDITVKVEKLSGESTNFRYILTYSLYDASASIELRRILVIKMEEQ